MKYLDYITIVLFYMIDLNLILHILNIYIIIIIKMYINIHIGIHLNVLIYIN